MCMYLSDSVKGEACASIRSCSVNSEHHEQDRLDPEGSCLKTEEPKVLALDSQKEKLTPERIKVRLLGDFSIDLYVRDLSPNFRFELFYSWHLIVYVADCFQLAHICHLCHSSFC